MDILEHVEEQFPAIDAAADAFMALLPGDSLPKSLAIAAEMAGLMLLRATAVELSEFPAGSAIFGAVEEDDFIRLTSFVMNFAASNDLDPNEMDADAIPDDAKAYLPELTSFEQPFVEVCEQSELKPELYPYVAAAAAGKLVMIGDQMKLLSPKIGLAMVLYHMGAGGKTVPFAAA